MRQKAAPRNPPLVVTCKQANPQIAGRHLDNGNSKSKQRPTVIDFCSPASGIVALQQRGSGHFQVFLEQIQVKLATGI